MDLPATLRAKLAAPIDALAPMREWIRPSALAQIHLTLHFLGDIDSTAVPALGDALGRVVRGHSSFALEVRGVDAFGGRQRPKVLWAAFEPGGLDRLRALQTDTGQALAAVGVAVEPEFTPHLTLARARRPVPREARVGLQAWFGQWATTDFGSLPVRSVALMRSQLGGGPARHSSLRSFELQ